MKTLLCLLMLVTVAAIGWSQTNSTAQTNLTAQTNVIVVQTNAMTQTNAMPQSAASQEFGLTSDHGTFDGNTRQIVYYGHVVVTNAQLWLACERLTLNFPPQEAGDHPTNAVAETNLDIIYIDSKGETNHLTCDKGVYDYGVVNGLTNETCTFTGHVTNRTDKGWITGEPMVWDNIRKVLHISNIQMLGKMSGTSGNDTNTSPFNLLK